jgi:hypothetical protein
MSDCQVKRTENWRPHSFSYERTREQLDLIAEQLERVSNVISSAFLGSGKGYNHYYNNLFIEDGLPKILHFNGVPCWVPGENNKNHYVMCITEEGIDYHPMGKCPYRLIALKKHKQEVKDMHIFTK